MSKLNSGKIKITNDGNIIMQFSNYHHVIDSDTELCYKHQADKVIAEKDAENESLLQQNRELCQALQVMYSKEEYDKQKYKRCLAMARWCESEENRLEAIAPIFDTDKECWEYGSDYWYKWRNRWLELAEKFKE